MPRFSKKSKARLATCDQRLQRILNEVIKHWDCTILEGHRGKSVQNEYFRTGRSKIKYPNGKHNTTPSLAVDVVPYPIDWSDWNRFYAFAGFVQGIAIGMGIKLRSGLDWDQDHDFHDQNFNDAPHFELSNKRK
jgi:hypothetical protein